MAGLNSGIGILDNGGAFRFDAKPSCGFEIGVWGGFARQLEPRTLHTVNAGIEQVCKLSLF